MFSALAGLKEKFVDSRLSDAEQERLEKAFQHLNSAGYDSWGVDPQTIKRVLALLRKLYTHYFRVETTGIDRIPPGRVLLIANHGGQMPIDGLLVMMSVILNGEPPRMVRAMVERWSPTIPFVSTFFNRCGQIVGNYRNCRELLDKEEAVLVFPEGVRGSGKLIFQRYELQRFGTGFLRLALETKTPIVPVAVIGCEETYPSIHNVESLAKLFKAPYVPLTPFFPLLGPLGALPLPTKVTIRYGEPLHFEGDADASEREVEVMVDQVKEALAAEIQEGLKKRGGNIFTGSGK